MMTVSVRTAVISATLVATLAPHLTVQDHLSWEAAHLDRTGNVSVFAATGPPVLLTCSRILLVMHVVPLASGMLGGVRMPKEPGTPAPAGAGGRRSPLRSGVVVWVV